MAGTRNLPLPGAASGVFIRIVLICHDLHCIGVYYNLLETEGFEVLAAFDPNSALDLCRHSVRPVRAAVVLSDPRASFADRERELISGLSNLIPPIPCILVPTGMARRECAVLIRIALRCSAAVYLASERR